MTDAAILGAGPAGLEATLWAARRGLAVSLLERGPGPGGLAASVDVGGVRVDLGSHRLHPSIDPAIFAELRELLGDELQLRRRNGRIRLGGRWISFPLRPADLALRLPPSFVAGAIRDALLAPARSPREDTFGEVLRAGLGPTICERFYFPYARKLWGLEPWEISGEQARRRVSAGSHGALLRRLARPCGGAPGSVFWYPARGYGTLWERLADACVEAGAEVRYGADVERVELAADGVRVTCAGGSTLEAGAVLSTIPLPSLARLTVPAPPAEALEAASALELRAMALVYLVVEGDRYTSYDAHYFPEPETPVTRISEPKNYREGPDPAGRTVLCAEIPCLRGDAVWSAGPEALRDVALGALESSGLPRPRLIEVGVRRLAGVYPIYRLGYERAYERLEAWADSEPRLLTFGRFGLFVHDNAHHALAMGRAAAASLGRGGAIDRERWRLARTAFAAHVVED